MSRTWTRRRVNRLPPDSGPLSTRIRAATALLLALLLPACGGKDKNENRIKPIMATLNIDPFTGTPDPAVYLETKSTTGDLVTVDVKLHSSTPLTFDAFTLEFVYDFQKVQIGDVFRLNPALFGDCSGGLLCSPLCSNNGQFANLGQVVDSQGRAHFLMGVASTSSSPRCSKTTDLCCQNDPDCPSGETCTTSTTVSGDTTLVTLAFIAATTIDTTPAEPRGSPIVLFTNPDPANPDPTKHGDCEILNNLVDLGVMCVDQRAAMTAAR
jgi:hypothetical protein